MACGGGVVAGGCGPGDGPMKARFDELEFSAVLEPGESEPTLLDCFRTWQATVEVRGFPPVFEDHDWSALERWLDEQFPGRTELKWDPAYVEEHDCPSCRCADEAEDTLTFSVRLPGTSRRQVMEAVARIRMPSRPGVAA